MGHDAILTRQKRRIEVGCLSGHWTAEAIAACLVQAMTAPEPGMFRWRRSGSTPLTLYA